MSVDNSSTSKLREVAKYQRAVIYSLLANIGLVLFAFLRIGGVIHIPPSVEPVITVTAIVVTLFIVVSVFMLAKQFTNVVIAALVAILMFVPLLSLILLLVFNQKATTYLQAHGVKVGFLSVSPDTIN